MIQSFVTRFNDNSQALGNVFATAYPESYADIVEHTVAAIAGEAYTDDNLDPARITAIDHGDYQGTILFIIAAQGYQPSTFYSVDISYGSCSLCDTMQGIRDDAPYDSDKPTDSQVQSYLTLALHIVQRIKRIGE